MCTQRRQTLVIDRVADQPVQLFDYEIASTKTNHQTGLDRSLFNFTRGKRTREMGQGKSREAEDGQKKQQEFVAEVNRVSVERQIQLQNQMRQRIMAMQVARARELFYWLGAFYGVASLGMFAGFRRTRKPGVLVPLLPLTFVVAYHADMAYGNKLHRIRMEAENILQFEEEILDLPCGLPTTSSLDLARLHDEEEKRFHPHSPPL